MYSRVLSPLKMWSRRWLRDNIISGAVRSLPSYYRQTLFLGVEYYSTTDVCREKVCRFGPVSGLTLNSYELSKEEFNTIITGGTPLKCPPTPLPPGTLHESDSRTDQTMGQTLALPQSKNQKDACIQFATSCDIAHYQLSDNLGPMSPLRASVIVMYVCIESRM
jgi:hypothetical protein